MATKHLGTDDEKMALDVFIKLSRASDSVMGRISEVFTEKGLTPGQFGVLETLHHLGALHQCELGKKLLISGGNVTMIIDNLAQNGFVIRKQDPSDRRYNKIHLTEEGDELITKLFPKMVKRATQVMSALSIQEQQTLNTLLRVLGKKNDKGEGNQN